VLFESDRVRALVKIQRGVLAAEVIQLNSIIKIIMSSTLSIEITKDL